jgi:signal transduction histidine kinase
MADVKGMVVYVATGVLGAEAMIEAILRMEHEDLPWTAVVIILAVVTPLALVRLWPVTAAILSTAAVLAVVAASFPVTVGGFGALAAIYAVVGRHRLLRTVVPLLMPFVLIAVLIGGERPASSLLLLVAALAAACGTALRLREERRRHVATEQSAAASFVEYAARGERARIARELHDVVAHHITMIALQADAARLATPGLPPEGVRRLTAIGDTARTALTEMRRLLGVLREDVSDELTRQPQPGLRQLTALLDEVRDAGPGGVRLIVSGQVEPLDPGIELTAYRIVQEALTNARRHAPGAAVDVELHYAGDEVRVRVFDNGPGPPPADQTVTGHGLAGMRERAAMAGGTVTAGPGPGTGFLVEVSLPTKGAEP